MFGATGGGQASNSQSSGSWSKPPQAASAASAASTASTASAAATGNPTWGGGSATQGSSFQPSNGEPAGGEGGARRGRGRGQKQPPPTAGGIKMQPGSTYAMGQGT